MSGGFAEILKNIQIKEQDKLESKLPSWAGFDLVVPESLNLQQCSSEITARYKASLVKPGCKVADLTGGLGADSWAFANVASELWYNERNEELCSAVKRNFSVLGISNVVFNSFDISPSETEWRDALAVFAPDVIYLDPARRDAAGRKLFLLEDCSPDVPALMPALLDIAPRVLVKVSPMADLTMLERRLNGVLESLHVVGAGGECKELLCICARDSSFRGVQLFDDGNVFSNGMVSRRESLPVAIKPVGKAPVVDTLRRTEPLLFVPSAAMVKSGLGPGISISGYSEELSHFGKYYTIIDNLPFASSVIKTLAHRFPQAEVTARGLPLSSEELRKKLGVKPGGSIHIFACVLDGERRLLVCKHS